MESLVSQVLIQVALISAYGLLYYIIRRNRLYTLISVILGVTTYFLVLVLAKNEFGIAAGLGLFAIFGILRYRTESIGIAEMTYIFSMITIAVIGAMTDGIVINTQTSLALNLGLILFSSLLFLILSRAELGRLELHVDSLDWMSLPREERISYLEGKSFVRVSDYRVDRIDWLRETCTVTVYHRKTA